MDSIGYLDELIKEYLLFRGYVKTYTSFTSEKVHDKTDHPDADVLAEQLLNHIRQLELPELTELWATLTSRFFTHLPPTFTPTIRLIETSLKRAYLVKAVKTGDKARVTDFYERNAAEMTQPTSDWEEWFILPYLKDPSVHPLFASYFNKRFFHTLALSVKNFLTSAFAQIPLPKLLAFNVERSERKALAADLKQARLDNEKLKRDLQQLRQQLSSASRASAASPAPPLTPTPTLSAAPPSLVHSAVAATAADAVDGCLTATHHPPHPLHLLLLFHSHAIPHRRRVPRSSLPRDARLSPVHQLLPRAAPPLLLRRPPLRHRQPRRLPPPLLHRAPPRLHEKGGRRGRRGRGWWWGWPGSASRPGRHHPQHGADLHGVGCAQGRLPRVRRLRG